MKGQALLAPLISGRDDRKCVAVLKPTQASFDSERQLFERLASLIGSPTNEGLKREMKSGFKFKRHFQMVNERSNYPSLNLSRALQVLASRCYARQI
jgi:hypothetical protein